MARVSQKWPTSAQRAARGRARSIGRVSWSGRSRRTNCWVRSGSRLKKSSPSNILNTSTKLANVKSELLPSRKLVAVTAFVATIASLFCALGQPVTLSVDGQRIVSDVPIRAVAEGLGGTTSYDPKSGNIVVIRGSDVLRLKIGSVHARLNGNTMTLKRAPFVVRGRAMVGLNVVKRAFGSVVAYDRRDSTIDVMTPGVIDAGAQEIR